MNRLAITLPDDLYAMARAYAVANRKSISRAIGELLRQGRESGPASGTAPSSRGAALLHPVSGFPIVEGDGRSFDSESVRAMEDDEDIRHLEMMGLSREEIERSLTR